MSNSETMFKLVKMERWAHDFSEGVELDVRACEYEGMCEGKPITTTGFYEAAVEVFEAFGGNLLPEPLYEPSLHWTAAKAKLRDRNLEKKLMEKWLEISKVYKYMISPETLDFAGIFRATFHHTTYTEELGINYISGFYSPDGTLLPVYHTNAVPGCQPIQLLRWPFDTDFGKTFGGDLFDGQRMVYCGNYYCGSLLSFIEHALDPLTGGTRTFGDDLPVPDVWIDDDENIGDTTKGAGRRVMKSLTKRLSVSAYHQGGFHYALNLCLKEWRRSKGVKYA